MLKAGLWTRLLSMQAAMKAYREEGRESRWERLGRWALTVLIGIGWYYVAMWGMGR